ncbi:general secretion pathway protein GspJ [Thiocystis minor]|uniref:prepilin-type N-terminal cleavage/methylation domain-containing protein n=1 Tax=Thiocystis minor TaxID=61597 RepID=UPI0019145093|nr:prepilin-type N-terminal cleavage/methylation domain-containing protein [Thiocystis minor]MBK5966613.1 general secretion pathway protein GspJ [Thiocystis minor]
MIRSARQAKQIHGFTLVELLIALAMISLITLLLFSGLRLGSRTWESINASAEQVGALRLAHGFLSRTLSQARFVTTTIDAESVVIFGGDAQQIEFTAPLSQHVGVSGLYILRLTLEDQGDDHALILTRWLLHPEILEGGDEFPPWEPLEKDQTMSMNDLPSEMDAADGAFGRTLLVEKIDAFDIAYYGVRDEETDPDWHPDWFDQSSLPIKIRIRLTTISRAWPDLVIALPAQPS